MPYTMACELFIYLIFSEVMICTARNDVKTSNIQKNEEKKQHQAPGTRISFRAFNNQPVICAWFVLLSSSVIDEGQLGQDRNRAWLDAAS